MKKNKIIRSKRTVRRHEKCEQYSLFSVEADDMKVENQSFSIRRFIKDMPFTIKL